MDFPLSPSPSLSRRPPRPQSPDPRSISPTFRRHLDNIQALEIARRGRRDAEELAIYTKAQAEAAAAKLRNIPRPRAGDKPLYKQHTNEVEELEVRHWSGKKAEEGGPGEKKVNRELPSHMKDLARGKRGATEEGKKKEVNKDLPPHMKDLARGRRVSTTISASEKDESRAEKAHKKRLATVPAAPIPAPAPTAPQVPGDIGLQMLARITTAKVERAVAEAKANHGRRARGASSAAAAVSSPTVAVERGERSEKRADKKSSSTKPHHTEHKDRNLSSNWRAMKKDMKSSSITTAPETATAMSKPAQKKSRTKSLHSNTDPLPPPRTGGVSLTSYPHPESKGKSKSATTKPTASTEAAKHIKPKHHQHPHKESTNKKASPAAAAASSSRGRGASSNGGAGGRSGGASAKMNMMELIRKGAGAVASETENNRPPWRGSRVERGKKEGKVAE